VQVLAVDGGDGALPARQGLDELEVDRVHDVVAVAGEERVWFLGRRGWRVSMFGMMDNAGAGGESLPLRQ
jgi:hypothetical protein